MKKLLIVGLPLCFTCLLLGGKASADADSDWMARSTAPGVTLATRFDTENEVLDHVLQDTTADRVSWTNNIKTSGNGAMRFELLNTDTTGHGNWRRFFHEGDTLQDFNELQPGDQMYVQFRQYIPAYMATHDWRQSDGSGTGFKQSIISSYSNSNTPFEVVLTSTSRGFPIAYHQDGISSSVGLSMPYSTACNSGDFRYQNEIDRGPNPLTGSSPDGNAWTACEQDRARYGGLYSYTANLGFPRGAPDPLTGAVTYPQDDWMTFLIRVKLNGGHGASDNVIEIWAAPDGEDYTLILSKYNTRFGGKNVSSTNITEGFTSFWLLPYTSGGAANPNRENTFTVYDEVIASTNFIPAPGFQGGGPIDPEPTVNLVATPATVNSGDATLLTWSSTDATSCSASGGWSGTKATSNGAGESSGSLTSDTTFTLSCSGPGGTGSDTVTVAVQAETPPPVVNLSISSNNVDSGSYVSLNWLPTNAISCTASGDWSGNKDIDRGGEIVGPITQASAFTLSCAGDGGTSMETENVSVNSTVSPTPTVDLVANPTTVQSGGSTVLTWSSTDATSCAASGDWSGNQPTQNSTGVTANNLVANVSYTLSCTGDGGMAADSVTVTVQPGPPPPTINLESNSNVVDSGSTVTLTWAPANATTCTASGDWSGVKSATGDSETLGPITQASSFTLTCTGDGGTNAETENVVVNAPVSPPPTVDLVASAATVQSGGSVSLTWSSTNATSCVASGGWSGIQAMDNAGGVAQSNITMDTSFTLTCTGDGGTAADTVNIAVSAPPAVAPAIEDSAKESTSGSGAVGIWMLIGLTLVCFRRRQVALAAT